MDIGLAGKSVLVTGGTRGLGRAVVLRLAAAGARVVTCSRSDDDAAQQLRRQLKETGGDHLVLRADVTRPEELDELVEQCRTSLGRLDVVVSNVGVTSHVGIGDLSLAEWQRVVDTNLTAAFLLTQKTLPVLVDGGSVVYVGTAAALRGIPLRSSYTAAKAGLLGLSRSVTKEFSARRIRFNVVAPGILATEEAKSMPAEHRRRYESMIALGRLGEPDEVAGAVLFLASDLAAYVNGTTVTVDGGI